MCKEKCSRTFECEGHCMLNVAGDLVTYLVFSPICKGTKREQEFWNKHIDEHPVEEIKEFYNLSDMDALVPGDFIRNKKNGKKYLIIENELKFGIVNLEDGHVVGFKDSISEIFKDRDAFEVIKLTEVEQ